MPGYGGYNGYNGGGQYQNPAGVSPQILAEATGKLRTSATIWTVIGIIQIVIGLPAILAMGYGITVIALGIWNIVQSSKERKIADQFAANPTGMVNYFESRGTALIIAVVLNVLFGGLIGVAGSIYDLTVKDYVVKNRAGLM